MAFWATAAEERLRSLGAILFDAMVLSVKGLGLRWATAPRRSGVAGSATR